MAIYNRLLTQYTNLFVHLLTEDIMKNVFHCNSNDITWENIVIAIVMTAAFVRHVTDGGLSDSLVKKLINGLATAMSSIDDKTVCRLGGWVSVHLKLKLPQAIIPKM